MITLVDAQSSIFNAATLFPKRQKFKSIVTVLKAASGHQQLERRLTKKLSTKSLGGFRSRKSCALSLSELSTSQRKTVSTLLFGSVGHACSVAALAIAATSMEARELMADVEVVSSVDAPSDDDSSHSVSFRFGDFNISSGDWESSSADELLLNDLVSADTFTFGDFTVHNNTLPLVEEVEPDDDTVFAFSDFAVAMENEMDDEILSGYNSVSKKDDEGMFVFGDFAIDVPDGEPVPRATPAPRQIVPNLKKHTSERTHIYSYKTKSLLGHTSRVKCLAFTSTDKLYISSSSQEAILQSHDFFTNASRHSYIGHSDFITNAVVSGDDKYIASTSRDTQLIIWDMATARQLSNFVHPKVVTCATFSKNSQFIMTGCQDSYCRLFPVKQKKSKGPILTFREHTSLVTCIGFQKTGEMIVSGSSDKTLRLWSAASGSTTHTFKRHTGTVLSASFSNDSATILSNDSTELVVWDVASYQCIWSLKIAPRCWSVSCYGPSMFKDYIVAAINDAVTVVYDLKDEKKEPFLELPTRASVYVLCRGGSSMLYGDFFGNIYGTTFNPTLRV